jgi:dolichyl-phosphate-mannose--protein O-mannosyl transferase
VTSTPTDTDPRPAPRPLLKEAAPPPPDDVRSRLVPPFMSPGPRLWETLRIPPALGEVLARWNGWLGPLLVTLVAGLLRFRDLGSPRAVMFDETYYAKDAWALVHRGFELSWPQGVDKQIIERFGDVPLPTDAAYVVHPPVGKYVIGLGELMFGLNPFGWRFMTAVLGTLSVLLVCRIGRRMFRSTFLGCLAGLLLAVDGLHFVMSRTALLDGVLMFFVVAAFGCLVVDRDRARARLATALPVDEHGLPRPDAEIARTLRLGARPWRWAAGLMMGLAIGTKWSGLPVLAAFGLLTVLWDVGARRTAGARNPHLAVARRDLLPAFLTTVPVALVTYLASWTGWILSPSDGTGGYYRNWALTEGRGSTWGFLVDHLDWLPSLWHYETKVWSFHVELTSPHTYQSNPWSWLVMGRPVSYFYESPGPGQDGCPVDVADKCSREVLAMGTPMLWWAGCLALLYVLWRWALRRDWRAGGVLCGVAAGYLPWFMYQERTIFLFYAVVFVPFLCLALAMAAGALLGRPDAGETRRVAGISALGLLVLLVLWNFVHFLPIFTGESIPLEEWQTRMWLDTWV